VFEGKLENYRRFLAREPMDRPLFGCHLGFFAHQRYPRVMQSLPEGPIQPDDIRMDLFLADYADARKGYDRMDDDYPLALAPFICLPWMEAIMGCPIIASPTSIWAEPCVDDWQTWHWRKPSLDNPWAQKLLEMTRALVQFSDGGMSVAPTLMRGPSDMLAAMRGADKLPLDVIDFPDEMHRAARLCADVWIEVAQAQLDLTPDCGEGYLAGDHGMRVCAPQRVIWLQEDTMALLSPTLFREFFLPVDRYIARQFPHVAFHLHGSALWAIDELVQLPELDVLELNLEAAFCDIEGTFAGWKKIQVHKPLVAWLPYDDTFLANLERILAEIPPAGLSIQTVVESPQQGREAVSRFFEMVEKTKKGT